MRINYRTLLKICALGLLCAIAYLRLVYPPRMAPEYINILGPVRALSVALHAGAFLALSAIAFLAFERPWAWAISALGLCVMPLQFVFMSGSPSLYLYVAELVGSALGIAASLWLDKRYVICSKLTKGLTFSVKAQ